jgi:hypothetical protein
MAYDPDPANRTVYVERSSPSGSRTLLYVIVVAVLLAAVAWALGLFNVDTSGKLQAPRVEVQGGEVPDVQVETADIEVGTKETTIEVPTIDIERPGDDGSAKR